MKFTKKQRHEIYKEAGIMLKIFKEEYFNLPVGLCYILKESIDKLHGKRFSYNEIMELMPEFAIKKPKIPQGVYWWSGDNFSIRVRVLNKCIKETA